MDPLPQAGRSSWHTAPVVIYTAVAAALLLTVLYPTWGTLTASFQRDGGWTLANYQEFFNPTQRVNLEALARSLGISLGSVLLCALLGIPLAFIFTGYEFPGRRLFSALAILPMTLPPLVGVVAFRYLLSETGFLPRLLQLLLHTERPPFALSGAGAVLAVHAYSMYVYFYLFAAAGLQSIDRSLPEAARNLGASGWRVFWRIQLPLLRPHLFGASLLVFMTSMASFSAPYILADGYRVLTVQIFNAKMNNDLPMAVTQTVLLTAISLGALVLFRRLGRGVTMAGGKGVGAPPSPIQQGGLRWLMGGVGALAVLFMLLPHLTLVVLSLIRPGSWTYQLFPGEFSLDNYAALLRDPGIFSPIRNSLWMSAAATAGVAVIGGAAAYLVQRTRLPGRALLETVAMLPWALPGTVVAMNLIVAFNRPHLWTFGQALVGSVWLLPLAYFLRNLPLAFRSTAAVLAQADPAIEEAARSLGSSWGFSLRRLLLPLMMPGLAAGSLLALVTALGEYVASVLLWVPANRPISIAIEQELRSTFSIGTAAAYSVFLMLLIGTVLVASRRWTEGRLQL